MTPPRDLSVNDLFARYLDHQTTAARQGLGYPEDLGDAMPHDTTPIQPIDPRLAWADATQVAAFFGAPVGFSTPPDWPTLVNQQEPVVALAFALGNYPQQVRHIHALLTGTALSLRETKIEAVPRPDLIAWARRQADDANRLLAAGALRLARQFDVADELLAAPVGDAWQTVQTNERAALRWHRGERAQALTLWRALPESAPVAFNVGMALLFTGDVAAAVPALEKAALGLPESSAWHHLAGLYLALAGAQE